MATTPRGIALLHDNDKKFVAKEPFDTVRFVRNTAKFILAISAVGSAAYGAYQAYGNAGGPKRQTQSHSAENPKNERSFFQAMIEANREALKGHSLGDSSPLLDMLRGLEARRSALDSSYKPGPGDKPISPGSMRALFDGNNANLPSGKADAAWAMAYLTAPAKAAPPPAPSAAPQPAVTAKTEIAATVAQPATRPARPTESQPAPVRPKSGFTETGHVSATPAGKPAAAGFSQVNTAVKPPAKPNQDDLEFATAAASAGEKDFQSLAHAQAVTEEFAKRYPQSAEAAQLKNKVQAAQAKHAQALAERSTLKVDTPTAPVMFSEDSLAELKACAAKVPHLDRLAMVTRPVTIAQNRLAFLVAVKVTRDPRTPVSAREGFLDQTRVQMASALGPCLMPLFALGSIALAATDGDDTDVTIQRINETEGSIVYQRPAKAAARQ